MKKIYYTLIALVFTTVTLAQGIAVQGIARDNDNSAISDKNMVFTFSIVETNNTELYRETETIRTDNFGIFSHIVSTGSPQGNTVFTNIDFSIQGLKMKVSVNYEGTTIEVYDQPFQYTAYAHYAKKATDAQTAQTAANGVPPGTVVAFMGETAPAGWLMCDGREIESKHITLRAMFSNNRTPNLRGRFLKGAGEGGGHNAIRLDQFDKTTLGAYQSQSFISHNHGRGSLNTRNGDGVHEHTRVLLSVGSGGNSNQHGISRQQTSSSGSVVTYTSGTGHALIRNDGSGHRHTIEGSTDNAGNSAEETKPNNFGVNYIIKF